ncbi:MAG: winged helix-turn-helix domain-containing protein [Vicingaceae bacterium]
MLRNWIAIFILIEVLILVPEQLRAGNSDFEEYARICMRMIGHELLLASGDSSSRVLPITNELDRYKISFDSDFSFDPGVLTVIVDSAIKASSIASSYTMEVKDCDSNKVVYSYRFDASENGTMTPCMGRVQPKGCYLLFIHVLIPMNPLQELQLNSGYLESSSDQMEEQSWFSIQSILFIISALLLGIFLLIVYRQKLIKNGSHVIRIGSFLFDPKNMALYRGSNKQELTGKENDLLQILYRHVNNTVERDIILREVWQDEDAYIGRTLDVYISKLRKKLELDPTINIINVRGVGYRMTLE